jgi:hypothetical protein
MIQFPPPQYQDAWYGAVGLGQILTHPHLTSGFQRHYYWATPSIWQDRKAGTSQYPLHKRGHGLISRRHSPSDSRLSSITTFQLKTFQPCKLSVLRLSCLTTNLPALHLSVFYLQPYYLSVLRPSSPQHQRRDLLTVPTLKAAAVSVVGKVPRAKKKPAVISQISGPSTRRFYSTGRQGHRTLSYNFWFSRRSHLNWIEV